jgi:hypothetical protein
MVEDHDPITRAEGFDSFADGGDYAGGLVSEDARGGMRAGGDLLQVRATDATGVHSNQHFSWADLGNWNGLEADIVDAAVHRSLHGRGDRMQMGFDRKLSGNGHWVT